PVLPPGTPILFILDDGSESPLGFNYHLFDVSCLILGSPAYQGKFVIDGWQVRMKDVSQSPNDLPYRLTFDHAAVFNLSADGTLSKATVPEIHPSVSTRPGPTQCADLVTVPQNWLPQVDDSITALQIYR
ncbi:MAG: hypothetical protein HY038_04100, partial [Nitrospirae bacterium]|nr:hypothetical protein [Nitrospirota bacterium]